MQPAKVFNDFAKNVRIARQMKADGDCIGRIAP